MIPLACLLFFTSGVSAGILLTKRKRDWLLAFSAVVCAICGVLAAGVP